METGFMNRITGLVIALVVGGLLVGGLLIPSIEGMTATEKTFENKGYYDMTYTETDQLTVVWSYLNPNEITVNGSPINIPDFVNPGTVNLVCGDTWFLRWYGEGVGFYCSTSDAGAVPADTTAQTTLTLTASNGTVTATNDAATPAGMTDTYTFIYVLDPDGQYIMKNANEPVYLKGDSDIYAIGRSAPFGSTLKMKITGNIDDGFTAETLGSTTTTIDDVEAIYTQESGFKDLYKLSKISIGVSDNGESKTVDYTYFIVPSKVTAELTNHMDATQIAMFGVISILGIVALVVVAANGIRNKY